MGIPNLHKVGACEQGSATILLSFNFTLSPLLILQTMMTIQSIQQPRLHSSTQQLTSRGGSSTSIYSPLDKEQGMLTMPQVLRPPVVHGALESQVPSSSYTWDSASLNKPSECHQQPWTLRRNGQFESDLPADQGESDQSDHETAVRTPLPLIRTHALEPLPPPIPSPPWSRGRQKTLILEATPTSHDLDKHPCRYDFSSASKGVKWSTRPFSKPRGSGEYSDKDSEYEGSSSRFKNARADVIALAQFRQLVESRQVMDHSSSDIDDNDPCSRVSTPEGYPEALRNRSKRPRSKSWDHTPLPRAKRQRPWVPTIVVSRANSDIEMADPVQGGPRDIRPSPASSCSFADNNIQMDSLLSSTANSGHISDSVVFSLLRADRLDSEPEALNSSRRFHCSVPGCTASYHSLWAHNRHQANHQVSLPSPTLAMNCTKCGTATKRFDLNDSQIDQGERLFWCSFGCRLSFSHVWKKELHDDRIHKGKAPKPSMCQECGAKPMWAISCELGAIPILISVSQGSR